MSPFSTPGAVLERELELDERHARQILDDARDDFRRAQQELAAARDRLLATYRKVHRILEPEK